LATVLLAVGFAARAAVPDYNQTLRLSEFMAASSSGLQDVDADYSDWIEIHNPTPGVVNLAGWYLTDAATNLLAGGCLVVFASDKNRAVAGGQLPPNFKLNSDGEYLGLVMPKGVTVASEYAPVFPPQVSNISYGLTPARVLRPRSQRSMARFACSCPPGPSVPTGGWDMDVTNSSEVTW